MQIVITDDRFGWNDEEEKALAGLGASLVVASWNSEDELITACSGADALLVNQARITGRVIQGLKKCRVISRYGIGYDNVDIKAAEAKGIWVTNVRGYCTEEVAEHALGMLLSCVRRIPVKDHAVRAGRWNIKAPIRRMSGRTLGIMGFGATGRAFWEKVQGFGFSRILIDDHHGGALIAASAGNGEACFAPFDELIRESDFISLHIPLREETRHIINRESIGRMKDGVILINTSRGPVIDEEALADALASGKIGAAGLDVFEKEPLPESSALLGLENVILTDHSAYYSEEAVSVLKTMTALNAREVLEGRTPKNPVNRPKLVSGI
ncbi:MAG: C-terminal binding protein [Spirochaetaceae bacterium]|jgi:D-3-phosphoglycerate dehydrogenase|nr:C-terminal binding protein [Spirochaetaceae bacterium]